MLTTRRSVRRMFQVLVVSLAGSTLSGCVDLSAFKALAGELSSLIPQTKQALNDASVAAADARSMTGKYRRATDAFFQANADQAPPEKPSATPTSSARPTPKPTKQEPTVASSQEYTTFGAGGDLSLVPVGTLPNRDTSSSAIAAIDWSSSLDPR